MSPLLAVSRAMGIARIHLRSSNRQHILHSSSHTLVHLFPKPQIKSIQPLATLQSPSQTCPTPKPVEKPVGKDYKGRLRGVAIVIPVLIAVSSLGLYSYYRSFFEEVPITKRKRMLWQDAEYDEAVGFTETWFSTPQRPIFEKEAPPATMVGKILDRLLEVELAKGLVIKLYVCDVYENPNSSALNGMNGGRIFIDTGLLIQCQNPDEVAGVLAHELGHIIARHSVERSTGYFFAEYIARLCGFKGSLGADLVTSRVHEREADHIGLILMAEAGINPQARIDFMERLYLEEELVLNGREPMPEFLSTHPSNEKRIKLLRGILPHAKDIFRGQKKTPLAVEEWDEVCQELRQRRLELSPILGFATNLRPDQLLPAIVGELSRIAEAVEQVKAHLNSSSGEFAKPEEVSKMPTDPVGQRDVHDGMQDAVLPRPKTDADTNAALAIDPTEDCDPKGHREKDMEK
ncbi:hypothetical protein EG329_002382 [Mollisiaceae sp. DMI_Dod_QoI]|nr:hypothetical protein EG329_002382 [Helotiales sp. DMI_Dod_QoI]